MTEDKTTTTEDVVENTQNETPKEEKKEAVEETKKEETTDQKEVKAEEKTEAKTERPERKPFSRDGKRPFKKNFKRRPFKREKPEFEQKILSLRRVTRVMAGGRRFSFSVAMVVGDKKNRVGLGMGKANDVTAAIEKAARNAKKNMIKVKLDENGTIPFDMTSKYKASEIVIRPVTGKGLAAGGAVRTVLEFAGVKEAGAKILSRSKNHINNARATVIALEPISEKYHHEEKKRIMDRKGGRNFKGGRRPGQGGPRRTFNRNSVPKAEVKKD